MTKTPSFLLRATAVASIAMLIVPPQAHAVSKEIVELQAQVQQLQASLQQMQQTNAEKMGILQHLVEQTADSVNKMSVDDGLALARPLRRRAMRQQPKSMASLVRSRR